MAKLTYETVMPDNLTFQPHTSYFITAIDVSTMKDLRSWLYIPHRKIKLRTMMRNSTSKRSSNTCWLSLDTQFSRAGKQCGYLPSMGLCVPTGTVHSGIDIRIYVECADKGQYTIKDVRILRVVTTPTKVKGKE